MTYQSLLVILIWSTIGWLFLLRTQQSNTIGAVTFERFYRACYQCLYWIENGTDRRRAFFAEYDVATFVHSFLIGVFLLVILVASFVIKVYATVRAFGLNSIRAIPENWLQSLFCLDIGVTPELVPGLRDYIGSQPRPIDLTLQHGPQIRVLAIRYSDVWAEIRTGRNTVLVFIAVLLAVGCWYVGPFVMYRGHRFVDIGLYFIGIPALVFTIIAAPLLVVAVFNSPLRLLVYVPAVTYRVALKATSITYYPFLLMIRQLTSSVPIRLQLTQVCDSRWAALRRFTAWSCILLIGTKILCYSLRIRLGEMWNGTEAAFFLNIYIAPSTMPGWQWATLVNSLVVLVFYYLADLFLRWYEIGKPANALVMLWSLRLMIVVTTLLGTYSVLANVWIIAHHRRFLQFPGLGPIWPTFDRESPFGSLGS